MKKIFLGCCLCVIFICLSLGVGVVYSYNFEDIQFVYNGKIFEYRLEDNIKTSPQFDLNYEINKYNRFGNVDDRIKLLRHMLDLGFDKDVAVEYMFPNIGKVVQKIEKAISIKPKDASLTIDSNKNKVFEIVPEVVGVAMDKSKTYDMLINMFCNKNKIIIKVPTKKLLPKVVKADFEKFSHLRADFSTNIQSSTSDRKHNVKNALTSLNKVEVMPNEVFSFNKIVGKRTAENGYRNAKIIVNNEFVDGIGGGVCQVSSTLYNAVLLAGLEVVEANKHSKQVGYVSYGFDAMVNFGSSDLKFKNNTSEKITIITNYSNSNARIRIFGKSLQGVEYRLFNEITNICQPNEEVLVDDKCEYLDKVQYEDEFFYLKKPSVGMEIKTFRHTYQNGKLINTQQLRHDKYKVQDAVKIYGTKKRTTEVVSLDYSF